MGILRPAIYLPERFVALSDSAGIQAAVIHELTHIRRGDLWMLALCRWLTVVLFAHPGIWWLRRQIRFNQELLADAAAAEGTKSVGYAELLIRWSRGRSRLSQLGVTTAMARPTLLKQRIAVLLDQGFCVKHVSSQRWKYGAAIVTALVVVALSLVTLQPVASRSATRLPLVANTDPTRKRADEISPHLTALGGTTQSSSAVSQSSWPCAEPLKVELPNNVTLELVGVREHPCWGERRWSPGGRLPAHEEHAPRLPPDRSLPMAHVYEVVIRVRNPDGVPLQWDHVSGFCKLTGGTESDSASEQLIAFTLSSMESTAKLCLGLSVGRWKTCSMSNCASGNPHGLFDYSTCDDDDASVVTLTHDATNRDIRVVALDADGVEHDASTVIRGDRVLTAAFDELPMEQVDEFFVQTRRRFCVESRNVALTPGELSDAYAVMSENCDARSTTM